MNILKEVGHYVVQLALFAIPFIVAQNYKWEDITVGALLSTIYAYLIKTQAVATATRG